MVGQTILHYRLVEKLGAGGMGEIYKAEDTRLQRMVAVKALSPRLAADQERRKRFFQEARAASALNHPNIITLYDIVSEDDVQCIIMEYVSGKTLREVIPPEGLEISEALQYAIQMASALSAAHGEGIIHRDLKPSNVMITSSGLVKILDFGLAKWIDPNLSGASESAATADQSLTVEGSIIGTVSYMSPEQALGKRVDTRSDIFSFGCVLYEMVTGRRAFEGSSGISTLSSILRDDVEPIAEIAPHVPEDFEDVILRCLAKDRGERWQSMKEIEERLTALATEDLTTVRRKSSGAGAARKNSRAAVKQATRKSSLPLAWIWGVGLVLIVFAATAAWWFTKVHRQAPAERSVRVIVAAPAAQPPAETQAVPPQAAAPEPAPVPAAPETAAPAPKSSAAKKAAPKPSPFGKAARGPQPPKASKTPLPAAPPAQARVEQIPPPPLTPAETTVPSLIPLIPVKVSDALPFRIVLDEDVPADVEQGKALRFTVTDSVRIGNTVVIAKGANVNGIVTRQAGKKKFLVLGGGKATFQLQQVMAVDGKKLNVRATSGRRSDDSATRPFDTGKGSKPKGLAALQGTEYVGYIDGDQIVSVPK